MTRLVSAGLVVVVAAFAAATTAAERTRIAQIGTGSMARL